MKIFKATLQFGLPLIILACTNTPVQKEPSTESREPAGLFDVFSGGGLVSTEGTGSYLFSDEEARQLTDDEILKASSSSALKVSRMRVLVDNDAAFKSKIAALKSAKAGETIRMSYYIYSDDHSSSVFLKEMLAAVGRGAQIKLFADLLTNYKYADVFSYLESVSRGAIKTRFFFSYTPKLKRDLNFLSRPCSAGNAASKASSTACSSEKWAQIQQNPSLDAYGKLLLSGILSKSSTAMKVAISEGQQIDPAKMKDGAGSKSETEQFMEFLKLVLKAKLSNDSTASVKVALAYMMYGDKLNPAMNKINGIVPLEQQGDGSAEDWEHISDFTHHKFLLIGNRFLQLGGRNIENSYHTKPSPLTQKYIFKDVDAAIELTSGGETAAKAFDELWSFSGNTLSLEQVLKEAPADFVMNMKASGETYFKCSQKAGAYGPSRRSSVAKCLEANLTKHPDYKNLEQRMNAVAKKLDENAIKYAQYDSKVVETWSTPDNLEGKISSHDQERMLLTYIENLHFDKRKPVNERTHVLGSKPGSELQSGKYLHYLWMRGMENACAVSSKKLNPGAQPKRVILHSAYFLPSSALMKTMGKMIDGTWDCSGVRLTILTNSLETTDLNIINLMGRYQMTAFYRAYSGRDEWFGNKIYADNPLVDPRFHPESRSNGRSAKVDYFEVKNMNSDNARISLHAKVAILGDDAIIGSANGDVRSYYMDTNNGFYIRGATNFVKQYTAWLDKKMSNSDLTRPVVKQFTSPGIDVDQTIRRLNAEDRALINGFLSKRKLDSKVSPEQRADLFKVLDEVNKIIYKSTLKTLHLPSNDGDDDNVKKQNQLDVMDKFDRLLQTL